MFNVVLHETCPDFLIFEPTKLFTDARGLFFEGYRENELAKGVGLPRFVQQNISKSNPFVLRGLHYQLKKPQGKFIRVIQGGIFDVAVDLRKSSPTFGKYASRNISERDNVALYIPPGFAHGFVALSEGATVIYQCTTYHDPDSDRALRWNDPTVGIKWPFGKNVPLTLSTKDRNAPALSDIPASDLFP